MRIISGKHKGRRFTASKKLPVRPTTDQAKESLFNILNNQYRFDQVSVLDLFAGIGSVSLEFISRGVQDLTAVDRHYHCLKFIRQTAHQLGEDLHTVKSDAFIYLEKSHGSFDLIFADPPYDFSDEQFEKIVTLLFQNDYLSPKGTLIIEHSKHTDLSSLPHFKESRKYGGTVFSFFEADLLP